MTKEETRGDTNRLTGMKMLETTINKSIRPAWTGHERQGNQETPVRREIDKEMDVGGQRYLCSVHRPAKPHVTARQHEDSHR